MTALIGIVFALALPACGSAGGADNATVTASSRGAAVAYVKCLRSHGVPNFPDPASDGRLPNVPSDIDTAAPAFRSAQSACAKLEPGAGTGPSSTGSRLASLLAAAHCMRNHGLTNFGDPTSAPPPPPPPGVRSGNAVGGPGGYLVLPPTSPAVTRAEAACGLLLP
ncbi:MAG TPA: hypothetical protein VMB27_24680 [Solirubrobacteraceae bacterium]|nr:hypothetical protein [Solirubrobacteraceae bacterium]